MKERLVKDAVCGKLSLDQVHFLDADLRFQ